MVVPKELNEVIDKLDISDFIRKRTDLINEVVTVCDKIINEVKHFDYNKEYYNIYKGFRESIDETYIYYFPHILDLSARLMIHEIYLAVDSLDDIVINSNLINGASSTKRKHFSVAKDIAEKVIKMYYYHPTSTKNIISYIEEYLPETYIKDHDINQVVWYFLVCITSLYLTYVD